MEPEVGELPFLSIRRVGAARVIDLRHRILRAGLPRESAVFPGDENAESRHYGAFAGDRLVGCTTLHPSEYESEPAWHLRGMAVEADAQRGGIGSHLLRFLEEDLTDSPVRLLWCNARVPASGFYRKAGWTIVSDEFEIPTAGPHYRMIKRLDR